MIAAWFNEVIYTATEGAIAEFGQLAITESGLPHATIAGKQTAELSDQPPAAVHVATLADPGLLIGDGLFETIAVYGGKPFAFEQHLQRLLASCEALAFTAVSATRIRSAVSELVTTVCGETKNALRKPLRLRITVWRTASGSQFALSLLAGHGPEFGTPNSTSAHVMTSKYHRNEYSPLSGHKSTAYAENAYALRDAQQHGADEAVLFNTRGELCEGTMTNIIIEQHGQLLTPPLTSGCLPGITRTIAFRVANAASIPLREAAPGELTAAQLFGGEDKSSLSLFRVDPQFSGAALTGTLRNIQLVDRWGDAQLAASPLLVKLRDAFALAMPDYV